MQLGGVELAPFKTCRWLIAPHRTASHRENKTKMFVFLQVLPAFHVIPFSNMSAEAAAFAARIPESLPEQVSEWYSQPDYQQRGALLLCLVVLAVLIMFSGMGWRRKP